MQPRRPQGHLAPPRLITMWPISPAAPRPSHGFPLRMIPPPTPVPQKTPIRDWYGRPAPRWNSASVATWTSFPTRTGAPSLSPSQGPSSNVPSQPGRFLAWETLPVRPSTSPGEPTPTPTRASGSRLAAWVASRTASAIRSATSSGPPAVGVGRRASPTTFERPSTTTAWIFVPPRSIPPRGIIGAAYSWAASLAQDLSKGAVATDQGVGRAVVLKLRLGLGAQLGHDPARERLSELHPPLVEGVYAPDRPLREHAVLIQRDQGAERVGGESLGEDRVGGAVSPAHAVGAQLP